MGVYVYHTSHIFQKFNKKHTFANYFLIVDAYSKISKRFKMENITTKEVMDKLDMFQGRSGKVLEFGWWDMEIIQTDAGAHFTSKEFQEFLSIRGAQLALA